MIIWVSSCVIALVLYVVYTVYFQSPQNLNPADDIVKLTEDEKKKKKKPDVKKTSQIQTNKFTPAKLQVSATALKDHRLFFHEVGGHVTNVNHMCFSNKGDFIATSSTDGNIRCMPIEDIGKPSQHHAHITLESIPVSMCFTQNSKRLMAVVDSKIVFLKIPSVIGEHKLETVKEINTRIDKVDAVQVVDVEKWMTVIVSGNMGSKPHVKAFNAKGDLLTDLTLLEKSTTKGKGSHQIKRPFQQRVIICTSPDDRFIAICGVGESEGVSSGDIGVFEVNRKSDGEPIGLQLKFLLSGHESEIVSFGWSANGNKALTCCVDGSWRLWDTSQRYDDVDHPRLFSGSQKLPQGIIPLSIGLVKSSSTSNELAAIVSGRNLYYCMLGSGDIVDKVEGAFGGEAIAMKVSADGMVVGVVVEGAKRISLWKTP